MRIVTMVKRRLILLVVFLLPVRVGLCARGGDSKAPEAVSLCDVLEHQAAYAGKTVIVTVRILSTKEGASLWSPECRKVGVHLRTEADAGPGIAELGQALAMHGLGDHPVIATLTGVFDPSYYDEIMRRTRPVFKAAAAKYITRARNVERR
jgi:hypothetical protein